MVELHPQAHLDTVGTHGRPGKTWLSGVDNRTSLANRITHIEHFNPEADVERAIESIAGTQWGEVAQDRSKSLLPCL